MGNYFVQFSNVFMFIFQLMLFANYSQKLDLVKDIFPDTFSTTHPGSVISLFTADVGETAIAFRLLSYARRSVK